MSIEQRYMECLFLAQAFETFWAYYMQSDAQLFEKECRKTGLLFVNSVGQLSVEDQAVCDASKLHLGDATNVQEILDRLRMWAEGSDRFPYSKPFISRGVLWAYFSGLKVLLSERIGLSIHPPMIMTSLEREYSESFVRWRPHFPRQALHANPSELLTKATSSPTIVVVGDIRHSQDLMTYAQKPDDFSTRMIAFVSKTRELIAKNGGIFDKFTGDGFIAYFNSAISTIMELDQVQGFLSFMNELLLFAEMHFCDWSREIRKLPPFNIGLGIGCDFGPVSYCDVNGNFVAVGELIVWANRMAAIAKANEIVINNLLHSKLQDSRLQGNWDLMFEERSGTTKSGESFLAKSLSFRSPHRPT